MIMDNQDSILKQYEEVSKLMDTFFEWRYKIMNRFFIGIAAIFISIQWMYSTKINHLVFIPLLLGGIFSIITALMDRVNQRIINTCYQVGKDTEQKMFSTPGLYSYLSNDFLNKKTRMLISYRIILQILYWGSSILLFVASLITYLIL